MFVKHTSTAGNQIIKYISTEHWNLLYNITGNSDPSCWFSIFEWSNTISILICFIEESVISSAPTAPDKSRAVSDWKDIGAIFQMDLFFWKYIMT